MKNLFFCCGLLLLVLSCNNSKIATKDEPKMSQFEVLYVEEYGGTGEDQVRIITNQEDFARYWAEITSTPSLSAKKFDSDEKMIIVKSFESRNSGGNTYEIKSVSQQGENIKVQYKVTAPDGMATMAITNPLMLILVDKVEKPQIEFIRE